MTTSRRNFMRGTGIGLLGFSVAGSSVLLSPRQARAKGAILRVLNDSEVELIEAFGEALVPGARDNGIAYFVDQQLSVEANDALLMIKYFNVPPPYADFYRAGLAALDAYSRAIHDKSFVSLNDAETTAVIEGLVAALNGGSPEGWQGPPAVLVYFAVRADAVDVVYGTAEGFERLGVPYMPHIVPPEPW
ncbi:MAG: gluconate 2-dehydrogenase subunit 3 family protein [Gammaproteobacteria bacterium]